MILQKTLLDLGWHSIQDALSQRCKTSVGQELAAALLPRLSREEAEDELSATEELRALQVRGEAPSFGGICDLRAFLKHAEKGNLLEGADFFALLSHVHAMHALRRFFLLRREEAPVCATRAYELPELQPFADLLSRSVDDHGKLRDTASSELGHLRQAAQRYAELLKRQIQKMLSDTRIESFLQDNYYTVRDDRYVLPVRAEYRGELQGIVHGTSGSGATLYVEPAELVDLGNRYKIALAAVEREEHRILTELTAALVQRAAVLREGLALAAGFDLLSAKAALANDLSLYRPSILPEDGELHLLRARHPQLLLQKVDVVANDIWLPNHAKVLVISGPNTGGKTVSLKTAGLCAMFLRAGLMIPADAKSRIPFYRSVYSDIGDEQSIELNLSTFSARLLNTLSMLREAGRGDLVLLDEVAAGTEPAQGAAIACAVLEELATSGAHVLTTTHYELPKTLALSNVCFYNASVGFHAETLSPTYRLHLGVPGRSSALEIAERLGASASLLARARQLLSSEGRAFEETLEALEKSREALDTERQKVAALRSKLEEERKVLQQRQEKLANKEKSILAKNYEGLARSLVDARERVKQAEQKLEERQKQHPNDLQGQQAAVRRFEEAVARATVVEANVSAKIEEERKQALQRTAAKREELQPGQQVFVASFGMKGTVESAPDDKGRVRVRVGIMNTIVPALELSLAPAEPATAVSTAPQSRSQTKPSVLPEENNPPMLSDATLDLRGFRVDDALARADQFLDKMLREERDYCYFIHGHGTGAIKQALRQMLRSSPLVAEIRSGEQSQGGDGVTLTRIA